MNSTWPGWVASAAFWEKVIYTMVTSSFSVLPSISLAFLMSSKLVAGIWWWCGSQGHCPAVPWCRILGRDLPSQSKLWPLLFIHVDCQYPRSRVHGYFYTYTCSPWGPCAEIIDWFVEAKFFTGLLVKQTVCLVQHPIPFWKHPGALEIDNMTTTGVLDKYIMPTYKMQLDI